MKTFVDLALRLKNLLAGLDGDLWRTMMAETNAPKHLPNEQEALDMVFRDAKAFGGYIPDLMTIMRKNVPNEIDEENQQALLAILGHLQLITRLLLLILLVERYRDHEDLITTFNGYRQSIVFVESYLAAGAQG
ncbi:MAG: hypothetical protein ACRCTY_05850 [Candidatus Adiutrix sp.]